ncbi:hypothetical protein CBP52_02180 [Cellulomonas sp. PSBB021]|nr:hypothetical protein CBP52_02180 [Cellulomonas sp. PSBB021]
MPGGVPGVVVTFAAYRRPRYRPGDGGHGRRVVTADGGHDDARVRERHEAPGIDRGPREVVRHQGLEP